MQDWIIYSVGFLAQILFSGRLIYQWISSEKAKKVVTPSLFWQMSLMASFCLFIYGWLREDFAIMLGQTITYFIYIRNLQIEDKWKKIPRVLRIFFWSFPIIIVFYSYNNNSYDLRLLLSNPDIPRWLMIWGSSAQVLFTMRFVYQWIYSEKHKESSLPKGFWIISLMGSSMILFYAILRKDPVLFVGHSLGVFLYSRNLFLYKKSKS